ncbi:signal peptidase I [Corynebacterium glyciniphilum]|uniref:signal peptidase I n=1 Tax=Corynebacterium glyciniphilum TaxID=1404244 RepID=UPI00264CF19C|nr:signal peptidase I [Corynebacterium glyciniphilum]MDN5682599.1 signal peptidase I [Corynebacterium glyciniphilum]MDN6705819.1 signal peptidase I [Corynebacterium glyciniphilum]
MTDSSEPVTEKKKRPAWVEYLVTFVVAILLLGLFNTFIGRLYQIPSESMEPTLVGCEGCTDDRIFVDKVSYRFGDVDPGDVVVFTGTGAWSEDYVSTRSSQPLVKGVQTGLEKIGILAPDEFTLVKRVVATGGQTVQCQDGDPGIMVDGEKVDDSFTLDPKAYPVDPTTGSDACQGEYFGPVTVPDDKVWLMGDNRTNSKDSRYYNLAGDPEEGMVPLDNVVGKVQFKVWPLSRIGGVD